MTNAPLLARVSGKEDRRRVTLRRTFHLPIEDLFRVLTEPEHISQWFAPCQVLEPRVGGRIEKRHPASGNPMMEGMVRIWDPPRVFEYDWVSENQTSVVRYELEPDGAGTRLTLTESVLTDANAAGRSAGWQLHLERLEKHIAGAPSPNDEARWRELRAAYRANL